MKKIYVLSSHQLALVSGGIDSPPTYGIGPFLTESDPQSKGYMNIGNLSVAPGIFANNNGAKASLKFGYPVTENLSVFAGIGFGTNYHQSPKPIKYNAGFNYTF